MQVLFGVCATGGRVLRQAVVRDASVAKSKGSGGWERRPGRRRWRREGAVCKEVQLWVGVGCPAQQVQVAGGVSREGVVRTVVTSL